MKRDRIEEPQPRVAARIVPLLREPISDKTGRYVNVATSDSDVLEAN